MGKKGKWFDAVQRALSTSENDSHENEKKGKRSTLKKILQFSKSSASTSSPPVTSPSARQQPHHHHPPPPQAAPPDRQRDDGIKEAKSSDAAAAAAQKTATATAVTRPTTTAPRAPARSAEELAAVKIQKACRVYLGRRSQRARGLDRLMLLLEGLAVKRQTYEALYCMQTMTRVQTQIHSRRVKTEEDKKALKSQVHVKQSLDRIKIGESWDHGHQSKEQIETVLTMKQEAALRRQRALAYAFSHQWSNRKPSSARASPPPMFMDTGNPNWGWSWAERWMAAARPWESQTTPANSGRAAAAVKGGGSGRRVPMSVQIPTSTPALARFTRPPSCPSPSTPTPRSPWRTSAVPPSSPGASPFRRSATATTGLRRTTSLQPERPRSCERRAAGSVSPVHGEKGGVVLLSLRRTTSLRSGELPRRLSLGGGGGGPARDDAAPLTPSYMQTTKSVKAKAARPAAIEVPVTAERTAPDHHQVTSPSVINRRLSLGSADRLSSVPSPSKAKAERSTPRRSRPPSPRF
ncbi:protein IQ-DOMAIN 2 [Oryza sativa Japonica Group]|uniref:protein IQ-DOMAIN 2 n=1 Tax=Oryza sativa subsp. japonica TaxID=39947 RepID=UPI00077542FE|nr:protein IQ-DOMAIN 1 [Oryza sativa Japonica Group]